MSFARKLERLVQWWVFISGVRTPFDPFRLGQASMFKCHKLSDPNILADIQKFLYIKFCACDILTEWKWK